MGLVIALAEKGKFPIACIIFRNDTIITQGYASEVKNKRLLVHAELKALIELDLQKNSKEKRQMELFTNLEPCMMCLGASISSFIGNVYYSLAAPSDGAAKWAEKTWDQFHVKSSFGLPKITSGILENESRALFQKNIDIHKSGSLVEWTKTVV